jgi:hypothetical protein
MRVEKGWSERFQKQITLADFYSYQLSVRDYFNSLLSAGRLSQQFIVDAYLKIEGNNLNFIRTNQSKLRAESYAGLRDAVNNGDVNDNVRIGRRVVLPSTFVRSPRAMTQNYQDAMAIVGKYGKPDLFITMTCNPNWRAIKENLLPGQKAEDRQDLVVRLFKLMLSELLKDVTDRQLFGRVIAYFYVIEFQERGLPHAHILFILDDNNKFTTPEAIDASVSAEFPDEQSFPVLYKCVKTHMIHGPYGLRSEE